MKLCRTMALALLIGTATLRAEEPRPTTRPVKETWEVAHAGKARIGYFRTTFEEVDQGNRKYLRAAQELNLHIKRDDATAQLRMVSGTDEDSDGKVLGVFMRQFLDMGKQVNLRGIVKGNTLEVTVNEGTPQAFTRKVQWDADVVGVAAQEALFQKKKARTGDTLSWRSFEPTINAVVTLRARVLDEEEVDLLGKKMTLLKAEISSDKIRVQGVGEIQLPRMTVWLDKERQAVRRQVEIPGLGNVVFTRTTKELATTPGGLAELPDILKNTLIPLNQRLTRPHKTDRVVYRVTVKDDDSPTTTLAQDDRQKVRNAKGQGFELVVTAVRTPPEKDNGDRVKDEYLKSNYFLSSDDGKVKALTEKAIGSELDPWHKARLIERWVSDHMKTDNSVPFTTAAQIAQNLKGDCRQHAMLTAAMCRAASVPSRTAVGVVYVENQGKPVLGFHMWTEVWVRGKWIALDATLGEGSIGAAHLKISDSSWHDVQSLTPLLPVARVLGKMAVEVVEVGPER